MVEYSGDMFWLARVANVVHMTGTCFSADVRGDQQDDHERSQWFLRGASADCLEQCRCNFARSAIRHPGLLSSANSANGKGTELLEKPPTDRQRISGPSSSGGPGNPCTMWSQHLKHVHVIECCLACTSKAGSWKVLQQHTGICNGLGSLQRLLQSMQPAPPQICLLSEQDLQPDC